MQNKEIDLYCFLIHITLMDDLQNIVTLKCARLDLN